MSFMRCVELTGNIALYSSGTYNQNGKKQKTFGMNSVIFHMSNEHFGSNMFSHGTNTVRFY